MVLLSSDTELPQNGSQTCQPLREMWKWSLFTSDFVSDITSFSIKLVNFDQNLVSCFSTEQIKRWINWHPKNLFILTYHHIHFSVIWSFSVHACPQNVFLKKTRHRDIKQQSNTELLLALKCLIGKRWGGWTDQQSLWQWHGRALFILHFLPTCISQTLVSYRWLPWPFPDLGIPVFSDIFCLLCLRFYAWYPVESQIRVREL